MGISVDVGRLLLARSGGRCANPECWADLFPNPDDEHVPTVAEMAHVIAESPAGPRGGDELPQSERDEYENLVLLCPTCHTLVDKMKLTDLFTAERLRTWKRRIEERVRNAVGVQRFTDREELKAEIAARLRQNHGYFRNYGPESEHAENPLSDAPDTWRTLVRREILPTNREILELLDANRSLLTAEEQELVEDFRAHVFGFAENHLSGEKRKDVPRVPGAHERGLSVGWPSVTESVRPSFSNIEFFEIRMAGHTRVAGIENPAPHVYVIERRGDLSAVKIFLTNSYVVGLAEYFEVQTDHPDVNAIVTIGPYNSVADSAKDQGIEDGVGVFQFKEFMGALHKEEDEFVYYKPPSNR